MATTTPTIWTFIDASPFWSAFFAQLLATLIVVIIGSVVIPPILKWRKRTKLKFFKTHTFFSKNFELTESSDGEYEATLHLSIKNFGSETVERFYWEMYFPKEMSVELVTKPPYPRYFTTNHQKGNKYLRHYGYVELPLFSLDEVDFVYEIKVKIKEKKKIKIFYFFNSDNGVSPAWTWLAITLKKHHWLKFLVLE
ncbi:MAG: hypothetical protein K9M11_00620 [Candidatus Pacebacteria bacterium]|nr:hypothetical protein [Candidatus Paceibacterota bacterium]